MTTPPPSRLLKTLSPNDLGRTGTHQSGILVPKSLAGFFPQLDEAAPNPDAWLILEPSGGVPVKCRYVHYNGRILGTNTRDEYRITWISSLLRAMGAEVGDLLEFESLGGTRYRLRVLHAAPDLAADRVMVTLARGWRTITLNRS